MNRIWLKFLSALILTTGISLSVFAGKAAAREDNTDFASRPIKVYVMADNPPQSRVVGTAAANKSSSRYEWLKIEIEFIPKKVIGKFFDDVDMNVAVIMEDSSLKNDKNRSSVVMFTGTVKYHSIEMDGDKHYAMALIPSRLLRRYMAYSTTASRCKFYVKVEFTSGGKMLATGYGTNSSLNERGLMDGFENIINNPAVSIMKIDNYVVGRTDSPWAMINVDQYEYEKLK